MNRAWIPLILTAILWVSGCGSDAGGGEVDYLVTIKTPMGNMKAILYEETPLHKSNFLDLAREGKYDNTKWHRIIEGFMIQGGDVYGGNREPEGSRIPAEIVPGLYHIKGALAAARQGDGVNPEKKSSSCQFYIVDGESYDILTTNLGLLNAKFSEMVQADPQGNRDVIMEYQEALQTGGQRGAIKYVCDIKDRISEATGTDFTQPMLSEEQGKCYKDAGGGAASLDGEYTVFGQVVEGLDVIDKIAAVQTGPGDRPLQELTMTMEVTKVAKSEITEKYGYEYPLTSTQP